MLRGEYFPTPCTQNCQIASVCALVFYELWSCVQQDLWNKVQKERSKTSTVQKERREIMKHKVLIVKRELKRYKAYSTDGVAIRYKKVWNIPYSKMFSITRNHHSLKFIYLIELQVFGIFLCNLDMEAAGKIWHFLYTLNMTLQTKSDIYGLAKVLRKSEIVTNSMLWVNGQDSQSVSGNRWIIRPSLDPFPEKCMYTLSKLRSHTKLHQ